MTIQTDYEDLDDEIDMINIDAVRRTFITENLKRINEMIEFLQMIKIRLRKDYDIGYIYIDNYLKELKADKQFLEEKKNA